MNGKDAIVRAMEGDRDVQPAAMAESGQSVNKLGEFHVQRVDGRQHNHCEIIAQNGLRDVNDVSAVFCANAGHVGDDAHAIFSGNGNYCFHWRYQPFLIIIPLYYTAFLQKNQGVAITFCFFRQKNYGLGAVCLLFFSCNPNETVV